jgi:hypothetical protein
MMAHHLGTGDAMREVYTVGIRSVKAGREEDFVRLWRRLGERTLHDFPAASGTLCVTARRAPGS